MTRPNRIYLQLLDENGEPTSCGATWCEDRIHDTDVEYVLADRLRLLEAVAEAVQVHARTWRHRDGIGMTFAEYLSARGDYIGDDWRAVLEALAALEEYDE